VTLWVLLGSACAINSPRGPIYDPLEGVNRKIYGFNNTADKYILKPIATGYRIILPDLMEQGITNVFDNLLEVNTIVNDLLQGKFRQAGKASGRLLLNTTAGIGGLFDVSSSIGLPRHTESFGQTLGVWGIGEGAYVVLPFFGPNNVRGAAGFLTFNLTTSLPRYIEHDVTRWSVVATDIISTRAQLLSAGRLLDKAALDPYLFLRDFWVRQNRLAVYDGQLPVTDTDTAQPDELDELDALDELDELDALDELDELDALDELDELDALDEDVELKQTE